MVDFFGRKAKRELENLETRLTGKVWLNVDDFKAMEDYALRFKILVEAGLKKSELYKKVFPKEFPREENPVISLTVENLQKLSRFIDSGGLEKL